jgi:hypothetical protein
MATNNPPSKEKTLDTKISRCDNNFPEAKVAALVIAA